MPSKKIFPSRLRPASTRNLDANRVRRRGGTGRLRAVGFTLVEVLVALVVIGVALTAVMQSLGQNIDSTRALRERTAALWVAQNRLARHYVLRDWPAADVSEGMDEMAGLEWRWREQVLTTPDPDVRRIEIEVRSAPGREALAHLVGFLAQPTMVAPRGAAPGAPPGGEKP